MKSFSNTTISLIGEDLTKSFNPGSFIFEGISMKVTNGDIMSLTGPNGSGKSTLLKIISGNMRSSRGKLSLEIGKQIINSEYIYKYSGFVAPYLMLYDEFSPIELIKLFAGIKGYKFDKELTYEILDNFNLLKRRYDLIRTFSSGMKQRMKFILALSFPSEILFLDEPTTNLDNSGISVILNKIFEFQKNGGIIIIATNDEREKAICTKNINLG